MVSFADTAAQDAALGSTPAELKAAVAALTGGRFFQPDGGQCAGFSCSPADTMNRKLMVIFTDGVPTMGGDPCALAAAAAAQNDDLRRGHRQAERRERLRSVAPCG